MGKSLGHYEVLERIGSGGMGDVYRARDTKLLRGVALKVLPPGMAGDPDRLSRFQREARAVAALQHPNIVTIDSVEEADGIRFLTMELVDGRTLGEAYRRAGNLEDAELELRAAHSTFERLGAAPRHPSRPTGP